MASFIEEIAEKRREEAARVAKEAQENGKASEPEKKEPTLEEIKNDEVQSRLFEMYLEKEGDEELALHLKSGELTDEEVAKLREVRKDFLNVSEKIKFAESQLDLSKITHLVESSPALKDLAEIRGASAIHDSLVRNLSEVAIQDPDRFKKISEALENISKAKEEIKKDEEEMLKLAKRYGFSRENYKEAMVLEDMHPGTFEATLKGNVGLLGSLFTSAKALEEKASMLDKRDVINKHLATTQKWDNNLAEALKNVVTQNTTVRKSFFGGLADKKEIKSEVESKQEKNKDDWTFEDVKKLKKEMDKTNLSDEEMKKAAAVWAKHYNEHSGDEGFDFPEARSSVFQDYAYQELRKKGGGFWAFVAAMFLGDKIEKTFKAKK